MEKIQARHSIIYWLPASCLCFMLFLGTKCKLDELPLCTDIKFALKWDDDDALSFQRRFQREKRTTDFQVYEVNESAKFDMCFKALCLLTYLPHYQPSLLRLQTERRQHSWDLPRSIKISLLWTLKVLMQFFCFYNIWIPMTAKKMSFKKYFTFFSSIEILF